jgi:hypothetical protein
MVHDLILKVGPRDDENSSTLDYCEQANVKSSVLLRVFWIGWLVTLLGAFVTGATAEYWWRGARLDMAMLSCLLLAVAAWIAWWSLRGTRVAGAMALVAVGMTLGFYGDSHVGDRLWWPPFPHKIIGGIVFYGLGHLAMSPLAV